MAGLPLRSLTVQGAVGLPPDWRQLTTLEVLRVVSTPEYGDPQYLDEIDDCLWWDFELATAMASLFCLELKGIMPGASSAQPPVG